MKRARACPGKGVNAVRRAGLALLVPAALAEKEAAANWTAAGGERR